MADVKLPYVPTYGVITKTLERAKTAATPARFTHDFLSTKLNVKGGSGRAVIPYLKRVGFLATDGSPTELYKRFRNPSESGAAAAEALRIGYSHLYEMNEYAHELAAKELKGLVVQATGLEPGATTIKVILGSFKALRAFADFDAPVLEAKVDADEVEGAPVQPTTLVQGGTPAGRLGLSYTINLNLPATSDVAVFDAIFKSLRAHLLR